MVICSHYEARFCFPKINCLFFFFLTSRAGLEYQAQCLWNMMLSFTSHLEHSWGYRFLWFSAFWNGQWEMVCWDLKRLHGFLRQRRAEAVILPISPGSCLPLIGFMGCFSVCSCCSWVTEVDVWTRSCRSCALSLRGLLTFLLWSRTLLVFQKPGIRILSCPKGKKKRPNEILQVQPILRRERKRDLSLMDRVSWCKSCITRSGNLIIQRMIEGIIPGVLSSVAQPA